MVSQDILEAFENKKAMRDMVQFQGMQVRVQYHVGCVLGVC